MSDSCWVVQGRISSVDNIGLYCLELPTLKAAGNNHEAFFFFRFLVQAICSRVPCKIYAVCLVFCGSQYISVSLVVVFVLYYQAFCGPYLMARTSL